MRTHIPLAGLVLALPGETETTWQDQRLVEAE